MTTNLINLESLRLGATHDRWKDSPETVIEKGEKFGGFPNAVGKTSECAFSTFLRVLSLILNSELPQKI